MKVKHLLILIVAVIALSGCGNDANRHSANGGYDDVVNIIKIAKKQNISILIKTDGYALMLEGQLTDSNYTESHYVFVEDDEVVVNGKFVDWDALEKEERDNNE